MRFVNKIVCLIIFLEVFRIDEAPAQNDSVINSNLTGFREVVTLTVKEAENIFLERSLLLLAQKMNIEEAKAQVIQARLWDNPGFYIETNPRNQQSNRYFSYGTTQKNADGTYVGNEVIGNVDQIIRLAGKRRNLVGLNKINVNIAEDEFYDLIRVLKFELRSDYYLLLQYQQGIELLESELKALNYLIRNIVIQVEEGNMPLKEQLRIEALIFDVENQIRGFISQRSVSESDLKTILRLPSSVGIKAVKDTTRLNFFKLPSLDSLKTIALNDRYDLKAGLKQIEAAERNFKLQKSLAYPDLDIGMNYTKYSNYILDYVGLTLRTTIPAWNRNQGNIRSAERTVTEQKALYENQVADAFNSLASAYLQFIKFQNVYFGMNKSFEKKYDVYFGNLVGNYERRTIGLLEFIDFFESYRDTKIASFNLEQDLLEAGELLIFQTGKELF